MRLLEEDKAAFNEMVHNVKNIYIQNSSITFVNDMLTVLSPLIDTFDQENALKGGSVKERKEKVITAANVFDELNETQVHKWVVKVEQFYLKGTPEFSSIFSKGEKVFNHGTREEKITELKAMVSIAQHYPDLATVVADMDSFCTEMVKAVVNRSKIDSDIKKNILNVSETGHKIAVELYANQGELMKQYKNEPEKIMQFIPARYFRRHTKKQDIAKATPAIIEIASKSISDAGITMPVKGKIVVYNSGDVDLKLWFAPTIDATMPSITKSLAVDDEITLDPVVDALPTDRYLMIQNENEENGEVEIIIVD